MDSLIRLRQLNQTDLSGYITQVIFPALRASGLAFSGLTLVPTGSGIMDLGTWDHPFDAVFANNLNIPSGSGINFGPNLNFTAYYSGSNAVLKVGSYYITSSPQGLSIIGPSGTQGIIGPSGVTGASGTSVTGIFKSGNYMNIYLTNGSISNVGLVSGASGSTGVSLTGFYQSGVWLYPLFSNHTTGIGVPVSGATGPQGPPGGILIDCNQFTGLLSGQVKPSVTIYNVDPFGSLNPTLNFVKGMRYTLGVSGLNLVQVNGTGANVYVDEHGGTGYLRFCFYDISFSPNQCGHTGRVISPECPAIDEPTLAAAIMDNSAWTNVSEAIDKSSISFNVKWSAQTGYRYGFVRSDLDGSINTSTPGGYVLGQAAVNYYGPQGNSGSQGPQGIPGPQGLRGPAGQSSPGVSIVSAEQNNSYQIRFHYSDNTVSDWFNMPQGGPQGNPGVAGGQGPSGVQGPQGVQGPTGDRYAASFYTSAMQVTFGSSGTFNGFQKKIGGVNAFILCTGSQKTCYTGDLIEFSAQSLIGLAYTPYQKILISSPSYSSPNNFYATVAYYNANNGDFQLVIEPSPVMPTFNPINFDSYNAGILMNLGGLGSQGPSGAQGIQGPSGVTGASGSATFNISSLSGLKDGIWANLNVTQNDCWDLSISGVNNQVSFSMGTYPVGKTVMLRIRNTGDFDNSNFPDPLLTWQNGVRFPFNDTSAPGPNSSHDPTWCYANNYTFVRFPNTGGSPDIMCTYAVSFVLPIHQS